MSEVIKCFSIDSMALILACAVLLGVWLAWRATKNNTSQFNFEDLLIDSRTGKTSLYKVGQFIALALSSWGFVFLTLGGKLTEFYFGLYMATWASAPVANKWLESKTPEKTQ